MEASVWARLAIDDAIRDLERARAPEAVISELTARLAGEPDPAVRAVLIPLRALDRARMDHALALSALHEAQARLGRPAAPTAPAGPPPPVRGGDSERYEVGDTLGKGGVGTVVAAFDRRLQRGVALKSLRASNPDEEAKNRFLREARVTARLDHPGVVPVHDLGTDAEGRVFYTMKRIRGRALDAAIKAGELPDLGERLEVFRRICDTVAYAHGRGVVHRDLKPANVMLGDFGEVYVVDWGLAGFVGDAAEKDPVGEAPQDAGLTSTGLVVGTPAWMSPEQAAGRLRDCGVPGDIYSLGAILYFVVTGERPFSGPVEQVIDDVRHGRFVHPGRRVRGLAPALDAIVRRAMRLDPAKRYPSVRALAADIRAFQADEPVSALAESALGPARRLLRRYSRPIAFLAGLGLVVTLGTLAATALHLLDVRRERDRATFAEMEAESARRDATRRLGEAELARALAEDELGHLDNAREAVSAARRRFASIGELPLSAELIAAYIAQRAPLPLVRLPLPDVELRRAWVVPAEPHENRGAWLLALADREARAWSLRDFSPAGSWSLPENGVVLGLARVRGHVWAVVEGGGEVVVGDLDAGTEIVRLPMSEPTGEGRAAHIDPWGERLTIYDSAGLTAFTLGQLDADGNVARRSFPQFWATQIDEGGHIALGRRWTGGQHREPDALVLQSLVGLERTRSLPWTGVSAIGRSVNFDLAVFRDGWVEWNQGSASLARMQVEGTPLLAFDDFDLVVADRLGIARVGSDGAVKRRTGATVELGSKTTAIGAANELFLSMDAEGVAAWPTTGTSSDGRRFLAPGALTSVALSPDGMLAAVCGWLPNVYLLEARTGRVLWGRPASTPGCRAVSFAPAGDRLAAFGRDGAVTLFDVATGDTVERVEGDEKIAVDGVLFADGRLVVAYEDGHLLERRADGTQREVRGPLQSAWSLAWDGDARLAVSGRAAADPACWVLDAGSLDTRGDCGAPTTAYGLTFRGTELWVATHDHGVQRAIEGDGFAAKDGLFVDGVSLAVAADPRGRWIAAGDVDGLLHVFPVLPPLVADTTQAALSLEPATVLQLHEGGITDLVMSPDGRTLYSTGDDGLLHAFDLDGGAVFDTDGLALDFASGAGLGPGLFADAARGAGFWSAAWTAADDNALLADPAGYAAIACTWPGSTHAGTLDRLVRLGRIAPSTRAALLLTCRR